MLKQAKDLGIKAYFISADGAMTKDLLDIAANAAEGTYYSTLALGYGISDGLINEFRKNFMAFHGGREPDVYAAYYYEVTMLVAHAIAKAGYDSKHIKDYLYTISGSNSYKGITGITSFDNRGEVDKPFYIYEVKNGEFVISE